jgi:hypothetical protein
VKKSKNKLGFFEAMDLQWFDEHPDEPISFRPVRNDRWLWLVIVVCVVALIITFLIAGGVI